LNLRILVGVCGFPSRLEELEKVLDAVEVQRTFYNPPRVETAERWRKQAPGLTFTVKAWQLITHPASSPTYRKLPKAIREGLDPSEVGFFRPTRRVMEALERTMEIARALDARVVVFQTPASFRQKEENLRNMFAFFRNADREGRIFGWEPRGDWSPEVVRRVCEELGLVHIVDPFKGEHLHGDIAYFRLHGISGYRYKYSEEELRSLAKKVRGIGKDSYVMFNNTEMQDDAARFRKILLMRSPS